MGEQQRLREPPRDRSITALNILSLVTATSIIVFASSSLIPMSYLASSLNARTPTVPDALVSISDDLDLLRSILGFSPTNIMNLFFTWALRGDSLVSGLVVGILGLPIAVLGAGALWAQISRNPHLLQLSALYMLVSIAAGNYLFGIASAFLLSIPAKKQKLADFVARTYPRHWGGRSSRRLCVLALG